jgi:DNA-binding beta-propeller fold protein YncE
MSISRKLLQTQPATGGGVVWTDPDLTNASYESLSFRVGSQEGLPQDLFFKPDGTKCYIVGFSGDAVVEYSLSTAWDISSASFVTSLSVNAQETTPRSFWFKGDGSEVYVSGTVSDSVHQYSLSTTWDVSSGTYTQSFSIAAQSGLPRGLTFKPDGTKMYVADPSTDLIYQYSLSSAWDISTASYDSKTLTPGTPTATSPRFNPDGTKLWLIDSGPDEVAQYSLTTAWDVSTGSYDNVFFDVSGQETTPQGFFFKSDGSKMYVVGQNSDTIYQYSTA